MRTKASEQDRHYLEAVDAFGPALDRHARGYEADVELRRDLRQEIYLALWRSFARFDGRCSLRTWVYRIGHNIGASHILKRRSIGSFVGLEELKEPADDDDPARTLSDRQELDVLIALINGLKPTDRQIVLLYLEELDATAIGEVTGLSPGAVAVKIHRIKAVLAHRFKQRGSNEH